jgi:hypothetical protein
VKLLLDVDVTVVTVIGLLNRFCVRNESAWHGMNLDGF